MMKKAFLFALAALCVSAAHAVTFTWSTIDGTAKIKDEAYSFAAASGISVVFQATNTDVMSSTFAATGNAILKEITIIKRSSGTDVPATVKLFDGDTEVAMATVTSGTQDDKITLEDGFYTRNTIHMIFDVKIDVTKTYTLKDYNAEGQAMAIGSSVVRETTSDSWLAAMRVTGESVPVPVPEPTALALIALGVAGLALKRKVA